MRSDGWEQRLADLITDARSREFRYGVWDCCLFACAAITALTGADPGAAFRGRYAGEDGCADMLNREGGILAIAERIAAERGFTEIQPAMAQRGDVVLGRIADRATLGVCAGSRALFAVQPQGLYGLPITDPALLVAWRIS